MKIDKHFIDNCIWMSYRYCIGRHTITAHYHAGDIAKFVCDNPKIHSNERKAFIGRDIKNEINNRVHYMRNISVEGFKDRHDALTLILDACIVHDIKPSEFFKYRYEANTQQGVCKVMPNPEAEKNAYSLMDIEDLLTWVKLAGYLDPTEIITWNYGGKIDSGKGFAFHDVDRQADRFVRHHVTCDKYAKNPHVYTYIDDEHITKVDKI